MAKSQKKTGKGRIDKYYKLAKEQGYRARSAFKLIQLNKKYSFLETARCCIDLCAAPGGWLQVASKYMAPNSIIVGVDLVPIKPIPRVSTFAADITTPQCRNLIRNELKDWKADVVLHDGAPNVGTAWVQDAYSQAELVLMSLKLAVEFLIPGGIFITKVFRSADYNNLLWVFGQLFGKVEATKPASSRNVSAEIFVVCREYLAPKHIDPKFLDPKHVFKEANALDADQALATKLNHSNVFQPDKKRRHRDGYEDGDYTLFKKANAATFIRSADPVAFLGSFNQIAFDTDEEKEWFALARTTEDIKANCSDLKVLGKGDFKSLLKWRIAIREEIGLDVKTKPTEELTETVDVTEEVDEEQQIQEELERMHTKAAAIAKRNQRRENEKRTRIIQRMQLQMTAPLDIGLEQTDAQLGYGQEDIFDLGGVDKVTKALRNAEALDGSDDDAVDQGEQDAPEYLDSDAERDANVAGLEAEMDGMYENYRARLMERDTKFKVKEARQKNKEREAWGGIRKKDSDDEDGDESEAGGWDQTQQAKLDGDQGLSESEWETEGEEDELPRIAGQKRRRDDEDQLPAAKKAKKKQLITKLQDPKSETRASKMWFGQEMFAGLPNLNGVDGSDDEEPMRSAGSDSEAEGDDFEVVPAEPEDTEMWDVDDKDEGAEKQAIIKRYGLTSAEAVTLAQKLVNRETTRTQLINDGFNRYSLNSKDELPSWFLDDESKHYKPNIPITKEAIQALRAKQRALDARPIKKVAEAKARKKMRAVQRLEKALKKAEGVNESGDISEKAKAKQIEDLMRKGLTKKKGAKSEVKLVVAKGAHRGIKGRPKGVKGRYTMVDSRMKKELRAKKRIEKATRKRKH